MQSRKGPVPTPRPSVGGGLAGSRSRVGARQSRLPGRACTKCVPWFAPRRTRPIAWPSWSAATRSNRSRPATRTDCSRPSCGCSEACCSSAPTRRGCRAAPRWWSIATCSRQRAHARLEAHPNITIRRGEVTALPEPGHRGDRSAHLRVAGPRHQRTARHRRARLLRRHRADRERRFARSRRCSTRCRRYGKGEGTDYLNAPMSHGGVRAIHRRAHRRRPVSRPRVRRGAVLRGLPAGRGDGVARARDAALRADEAGGPARSAHRPRAVGGGAASPRGQGGADVEPGRLPDPAPDSGAAAGVPDDSRASRTPSSCATAAFIATAISIRRRRWARA